jgi:hypothetical protein
MSRQRAVLVLTTVNNPTLLNDYTANFKRYEHLDQVEVIVIPDEKTPPAAYELCRELVRGAMKIVCPTLAEQDAYLAGIGLSPAAVPRNSDNRRNVGYLMAYASGAEFLISIDDDNYCLPDEDYFAEHAVVCGDNVSVEVVESATGYYNICNLLVSNAEGKAYPRGFPFKKRHLDEALRTVTRTVPVHINAGLWTLDPDIDAISWLVLNPHVSGFRGRSVALGSNTWTPVNTQNTSLRRAAIPAYYFIRMGYPISGLAIDRYGDILSGYFAQACARQLGGYVRVGTPVAEHKRNSHNYLRDATGEWACILTLEDLLPWLTEHRLEGNSYLEKFEALSYGLEDAVETMRGPIWTDATRGYFHQTAYYMRLWAKACRTAGN